MPGRDIIVIAASAGGVEALKAFTRNLPVGLPAAVFVVLHVPPDGTSVLPQILSRSGPLPARHAISGEAIRMGRIYVAPPDQHLLLRPEAVELARGARENGHRPAGDALFRSAALHHGPRVIGVVLSGTLDDGTAGLIAVKRRGGLALVQDPADAIFPGMPLNAVRHAAIDATGTAAELAEHIARLTREPLPGPDPAAAPEPMVIEDEMADLRTDPPERDRHPGTPSGFGCPDCGGALWELHDGELIRYRCRVGHAWSPHSLLARQSRAMEQALWVAMRALEERAALASRIRERMARRGQSRMADRYGDEMRERRRRAELIRAILSDPPTEAETGTEGPRPDGPDAPRQARDSP